MGWMICLPAAPCTADERWFSSGAGGRAGQRQQRCDHRAWGVGVPRLPFWPLVRFFCSRIAFCRLQHLFWGVTHHCQCPAVRACLAPPPPFPWSGSRRGQRGAPGTEQDPPSRDTSPLRAVPSRVSPGRAQALDVAAPRPSPLAPSLSHTAAVCGLWKHVCVPSPAQPHGSGGPDAAT